VVEHGHNGLLVPVGSPAALANAIVMLLTNRNLAARYGCAARQKAEEHFDEERVFAIVTAAYARLLREKGVGGGAIHPAVTNRTGRAFKRVLDIGVSAVALIVLLPVMALVAAIVYLTMGSPVLFRQLRPGLHAKPFVIFKFRTMRTAVEDAPVSSDADRLTFAGRILRAISLDELPQLINVFKGDMSLVGPRPLLMQYVDRYSPEQARRHDVKPGITGWAQVNGRNVLSWEDRFELDVWYVDHQSVGLDLQILMRTIGQVIRGRGVSAPGEATMHEFLGSER
jgi:lipopolysaccharide/colanic/teichoic acid biosynthesis glycosyltransferase